MDVKGFFFLFGSFDMKLQDIIYLNSPKHMSTVTEDTIWLKMNHLGAMSYAEVAAKGL